MSLYLTELTPVGPIDDFLATVQAAVAQAGGEFIEAQVTADHGQVFVILEGSSPDVYRTSFSHVGIDVTSVDQVRLVGADLEEVKRTRPTSGYLVEWDIPAGITMDAYLARKKEKSPLYAQVPETTFQRTYVREDMVKCLCFYEAPDEAAVVRARDVVSTPIDRLHRLDSRDSS